MGGMSQHAAPRRVIRSRHDRVLAGVAAGLGQYFGIDPAVVRLAFVALAFVGGLGVLLYLAAWVLIPDEPATGQPAASAAPARSWSTVTWTLVVLVTAVLVIAGVGRVGLGLAPRVVWPLALIGFGIALLWLRATNDSSSPTGHEASAPPIGTAQQSAPPTAEPTAPSASWTVAPITESPLRRAAPVVGRMLLAVAVAGTALVATVAAILLLEGPGSIAFTPLEAAISAIAVAVVAVVVGVELRRVVDAGVVAIFVIAALSIFGWIGPPFHGGFGTRDIHPSDLSSVGREYHLAGGELVLDLGDIDVGTQSRSISATVAAGRLEVVVPDQVTVLLDAHVDAGVLDAFGRRDNGVGVDRHSVERATVGTLHVHARVGLGNVLVERVSARRHAASPRPPTPLFPAP